MKYKLTLVIEMESGEAAKRTYAHLVGVNEMELYPHEGNLSFSGACIPSLFTLMRPAHVSISPVEELKA